MEFMRGVLGVLAAGCCFMLGRTLVGVRRYGVKLSKLYGWVIRAAVCVAAVAFRNPVDVVDYMVWGVSALMLALGYVGASGPRREEDLTEEIFKE
jgi:hypothetical protein